MRALTVWQPWASLTAIGAKPWEFRGWDFTTRPDLRVLVNQRIAVHTGARPIRILEVLDILARIRAGNSALKEDLAKPLLTRLVEAHTAQRDTILPYSAVLATAILRRPIPVSVLFKDTADSDRLDHSKFGWPLDDVIRFEEPIPVRGAQGFWHFRDTSLH